MRRLFELNLHCAKCGNRLNLKYKNELEEGVYAKQGYVEGEECGGYKVHHELFVEPCRNCNESVKQEVSGMLNKIEQIAHKINNNN